MTPKPRGGRKTAVEAAGKEVFVTLVRADSWGGAIPMLKNRDAFSETMTDLALPNVGGFCSLL